jgi:hypothetical protein
VPPIQNGKVLSLAVNAARNNDPKPLPRTETSVLVSISLKKICYLTNGCNVVKNDDKVKVTIK